MSKFSRFVQEASNKGLLSVQKLENGQLEIDIPAGAAPAAPAQSRTEPPPPSESRDRDEEGGRPRRGRRGRGGRGRDREDRGPRPEAAAAEATPAAPHARTPAPPHSRTPAVEGDGIGVTGERLTRQEAFDLVRRTVAAMASDDTAVRASAIRSKARELLGRDSESLSDRMFVRVLKDAHDNGIIDLRRRGDDFEVARAAEAESVADQLAKAAAAHAPQPSAPSAPAPRVGMGPRGAGRGRGRLGAPPADLLSIGVVSTAAAPADEAEATLHVPAAPTKGRKPAARKKAAAKQAPAAESAEETAPRVAKKSRGAAKPRAKKAPAGSAT